MTMKVGRAHEWNYRSNWREKKVRPGLWLFNVKSLKRRVGRQYKSFEGSPIGTGFTWSINGIQRLWKVSPNRYAGYMKGRKKFISRSR